MSIKNISSSFLPPSGPGRIDKTDSSPRCQESDSVFSSKLSAASRNTKTDTIELSGKTTEKPVTMSAIRDKIVSEIKSGKDVQSLDEIRARLASKQYATDPDELADSILSADTGEK